jgi:hypothetical protein
MKYLNNESQFTRISDDHARMMMESLGYTVPSQEEQEPEQAPVDVYAFEDYRFALSEEIVEANDGHYIRLDELDESFTVHLDESGEEILIEFVEFDDVDYILEGVYEDEEGNLFARMLSADDEIDEAKEEMMDMMKDKMKDKMKEKGKKAKGKKKPFPKKSEMEDESDECGDEE